MAARTPIPGLRRLTSGDPGPLFRQVKRELQRVVESGRLRPGDALPSEGVLAGALGVSIGTLRRAVDEMVHEQLLVRRQGKGTFVAQPCNDRFLFQFFHIERRDDLSELPAGAERELPQVECVGFVRAKADDAQAAALRISAGDLVLRIDNRLSLAGRPVVHDRLTLTGVIFRGLSEKRFRERPSTIYSLYQVDHGITVLRAHERARAVAAGREPSAILGVAPGAAVLEVHRIALTFGDRPVEYRVSTINTADYDYVSLLSRRG